MVNMKNRINTLVVMVVVVVVAAAAAVEASNCDSFAWMRNVPSRSSFD